MPRLFRESPVNAIWEGSGNVQCLDVLRALAKSPDALAALFAEFDAAKGGHAALDRHIEALKRDLSDPAEAEFRARDLVDRMAIGLQAALLLRHAPAFVADPFIASRIEGRGQHHYGTLPRGTDCRAIIERGMPICT